ncbi:GH92 family glycosyl hydrolase [Kitasatospora sp. NPDC004272]
MTTRHPVPRLLRPLALVAGLLLVVGGGAVAQPAAATVPAVARVTVDDPAQYVNPFVGTASSTQFTDEALNGGHTFPGASAPFGMVQWSPDTGAPTASHGGVSYDYRADRIYGFSLNHLSGAGCDVFGNFPFMPRLGTASSGPATFSHANESASPGTYSVTFDNGITTRLAATQRAGIAEFDYPAGQGAALTVDAGTALNGGFAGNGGALVLGGDRVSGYSDSGGFCGTGKKYRVYFSAVFDRGFSTSALLDGGRKAMLSFDTSTNRTVTVRVGLSYVSTDNAYANMQAEEGANPFGTVAAGVRSAWNTHLGRIAVAGGSLRNTRTFYTALYHSLLAPNVFSDADGRYIGFDNQIRTVASGHAQYTNFSGWDVYRSQMQLLALLCPQEASDIGQSIVNQGAQAGYLDRWPVANGGAGTMDGDPMPIIGSSLYAFGAKGFDAQALLWQAWAGTVKDDERPGQSYYLSAGYLPHPYMGWAASVTLDYATADFAVSQLAARLGDAGMYDIELHRSASWRNLFNTQTRAIQPRAVDHSWPASPPTSRDGFQEGDGAQYTWSVPQNPRGLIAAMGGSGAAVTRLDTFFGQLNGGMDSPYAYLGNEPSVNIPWLYTYAQRPDRTQAVVRQALLQLYSDAPDGEPGNDDLGAMSSWAVWAALGMYPQVPGRAELVLASPAFPSISLTRENGVAIDISAPGAADDTPYVTGLAVNGTASGKPWLGEDFVTNGGSLQYTLSSTPSPQWGRAAADAPPSFDVGPAAPATGTITGPGGKCLDDNVSSVADGNRIQIWDCNNTAAQQWTLAPDGTVQVFGHCLDVYQSGTDIHGVPVQLFTCNGSGAQQWWPKSDGSLVNTPSNLCLDLPNGNTTNGQPLQVYLCNSTASQKWNLPH